jgi:TldD protein
MKNLEIAKNELLAPANLGETQLQTILSRLLSRNVDMADLYFQAIQYESWSLEDSIIKDGSFSTSKGVGVRAVSGEKSGFAYCDDIYLPSLEQAASAAKSITKQGDHKQIAIIGLKHSTGRDLYVPENPLLCMPKEQKIALLQEADAYARQLNSKIKQVNVSLSGAYEIVLVVNTDGSYGADVRPLVRMNVDVLAEDNGRRERGFAGGGGRFHYDYFQKDNCVKNYVDEAVRQALVNLNAVAAPAGTMPVVLGPGWPGVLLHEAIGHGLEGDFNRKGSSAFSGRLGERVASPECTVVDDGTLAGRRGSLNMDDEGTKTQCNVLIENGILKTYMQDKLNARLMGMQPTGNARRESYAHLPMPRMTNTYMLNGKHEKDEIIKSVKKGLYAVNFGGGQVDITSGKFVFSASEAYLIEDGIVTAPVKGATLIGHGPEVLTKVSMVGNDLQLDSGVGTCGKEGQSVPVGVGQPTLKVDALTVGGTNFQE